VPSPLGRVADTHPGIGTQSLQEPTRRIEGGIGQGVAVRRVYGRYRAARGMINAYVCYLATQSIACCFRCSNGLHFQT